LLNYIVFTFASAEGPVRGEEPIKKGKKKTGGGGRLVVFERNLIGIF